MFRAAFIIRWPLLLHFRACAQTRIALLIGNRDDKPGGGAPKEPSGKAAPEPVPIGSNSLLTEESTDVEDKKIAPI